MNKLLAASLVAAAATASAVPAGSQVIFGNLGSTGAGLLSATNTDIGTDYAKVAVGFNTGYTVYYLDSVTIGLFYDNTLTTPITVGLYSGLNTLIATSSAVNVGNTGKYTFTFNHVALSNLDSGYTIQPAQGSWYAAKSFLAPTGQNGSDLWYDATYYYDSALAGWDYAPFSYSISLNGSTSPIPEPSTYGIALGGLALAGAIIARRRKQAK